MNKTRYFGYGVDKKLHLCIVIDVKIYDRFIFQYKLKNGITIYTV